MRISIVLAVVIALLSVSCKKQGQVTTEHELSEFDTLVFSDVFDVTLIQDSVNHIKVIGTEKFVGHVQWEISNNTLTIKNEGKYKWLNPSTNKIKLEITVNDLAKIVANETCNISTQHVLHANELGLVLKSKLNHASLNVDCNTFYYWNNFPCGGSVALQGTCHTLKLWNYALMQINARQLETKITEVENTSKGDIHVWCTDSLSYKINGTGNIYLHGNPTYLLNHLGSGSGKLLFE